MLMISMEQHFFFGFVVGPIVKVVHYSLHAPLRVWLDIIKTPSVVANIAIICKLMEKTWHTYITLLECCTKVQ